MNVELLWVLTGLAFVVAILKFAFDRQMYGGDECEYCEKLIEEKFGMKEKVFVVDEAPKDAPAFVSRSGIYVQRKFLMPGREKVLEALLEHEVEHVKSHDVYKMLVLKLTQYGLSTYMFFAHGVWWGLATMVVLGIVAFLFHMEREMYLAAELIEQDPEVVEELLSMSS